MPDVLTFDDVKQAAPQQPLTFEDVPKATTSKAVDFKNVPHQQAITFDDVTPATTLRGPLSLPEFLKGQITRKGAQLAQSAVRGTTLRNLQLPISEELTDPLSLTERVLSDVTEFGTAFVPFWAGAGAVGLLGRAAAGATKIPAIAKTAQVLSRLPTPLKVGAGGFAFGAATKPETDTVPNRLQQGLVTGTLTAGVTAAIPPIIRKLAQVESRRVGQVMDKLTTVADDVQRAGQSLNTDAAYTALQQLPSARDRHAVLNLLRQRQGVSAVPFENRYARYAENHVISRFVAALHQRLPEPIKRAFIYRYGQPAEYAKAADHRLLQLALQRDKAGAVGALLSRKLPERELTAVLKILGKDDPALLEQLVSKFEQPFSRAEQQRTLQLIQGGITAGVRPDLATIARVAREEIDLMSQAIQELPLPEFLKQTIQSNMGSYTRRYYRSKEGQSALTRFFFGRRQVRMRGKELMRRENIPVEVRTQMGEVRESPEVVARTINDLAFDVETNRLFDYVARNPALASVTPQPGWVPMSSSKVRGVSRIGRLEGMSVHPDVAADINDIVRIPTEGERTFNAFLSLWKFGKVPLNPPTIFRNLYSNTWLMEASGIPLARQPGLLSLALEDMRAFGRWSQEARQVGLSTGTFNQAEIESMLRVYRPSADESLLTLPERLAAFSQSHLFKTAGEFYQKSEVAYKLASYIDSRTKGLDPQAAADYAQKWLFNYSRIPSFIRDVRNLRAFGVYGLGVPFITFQYKVLPRVLEAAIKRPLMFFKYPLMLSAMETYAMQKLGLSEEDVQSVKRSQRGNLKYLLPFRDQQDNFRLLDMQYVFPFGELMDLEGASIFGSLISNPVYSGLVLAHGVARREPRQPYTNRLLVQKGAPPAEAIRNLAAELGSQLAPPLTPGVGFNARKLWAALNGQSNYAGIQYDLPFETASTLFGFKTLPTTESFARIRDAKQTQGIIRQFREEMSSTLRDRSLTNQQQQFQMDAARERLRRQLIEKEF